MGEESAERGKHWERRALRRATIEREKEREKERRVLEERIALIAFQNR